MIDDIRPGSSEEIVQLGLDQAAQAVMSAEDVPLALADELSAMVSGPAVRAVLEERIVQVVHRGHTIDADDMFPIGWLPMEARHRFERVRDALVAQPRDLGEVRRLLVEGAALALAAIARLDRAVASGEEAAARPHTNPRAPASEGEH